MNSRRHPTSRRGILAALGLAGALATSVLYGSPAHADDALPVPTRADSARQDGAVRVPVRTVDTPDRGGQNGIVEISIGGSDPIPVIVDTGFTGLVLFPGATDLLPAGVRVSEAPAAARLPGGESVPGRRGQAYLTIGGVRTTVPIPFVATSSDKAYLREWTAQGVYGLLGVGTKGTPMSVNPITALPGRYGQRWSIHFARTGAGRGAIVLGAAAPAEPVMAFTLPPLGTDASGAPRWNDQAAPGCWRFGRQPEHCVDTWFDAAFTVMRVKGKQFADVPTNAIGLVRRGTPVELAAAGSAFVGHRFVAGRQASRNLARVIDRGSAVVNTGNSFYFDYDVTYNAVTGRLYLSHPAQKGQMNR